jgi:1-deoxy-D-xylulose-5-phosphate reductoisomerase
MLAQLGAHDMRVPIAFALGWPARLATATPRLDLATVGRLDFEQPDPTRFPALGLARAALRQGGGAPTILNAANEVAVAAFLEGRIGFLEIAGAVERVLGLMHATAVESLETMAAVDAEARVHTAAAIARSE